MNNAAVDTAQLKAARAAGAAYLVAFWLKSRYIPRSLAAFGFATSLWCLACAVVFIVLPSFADIVNLWWFDLPMGLFDIALSVWLLVRGLARAATD